MTLRCAGSLPEPVVAQVSAIQKAMAGIEPRTEAFLQLQRQYFLTVEKYLDRGAGFCPFKDERCCQSVREDLKSLSESGWYLKHYVLMPNHLPALFHTNEKAETMKTLWAQWKGRTARECNRLLGRQGAFWHKDWFDRWMRNEAAAERTIRYIRNNPVKAGLVKDWRDFKWVE